MEQYDTIAIAIFIYAVAVTGTDCLEGSDAFAVEDVAAFFLFAVFGSELADASVVGLDCVLFWYDSPDVFPLHFCRTLDIVMEFW